MDFESYSQLIESTFAFLGLNPMETRAAEKGQWIIYNGDTEIYIDLWEVEKENAWLYFESDEPVFAFQVVSPVCLLPENGHEQLYASYIINKDQNMLAVKFRRPAKGLTQEEIIESIESIGFYSESTYKALEDRYTIGKIVPEEN